MITGFNTDVEHDGVIYHVQTEDKGLESPIILSLVYSGGAILAAKRAPYEDLIAAGFDENVLAERLKRQHRLICAAIHAGRIADLKRMSSPEATPSAEVATPNGQEIAPQPKEPSPPPPVEIVTTIQDELASIGQSAQATVEHPAEVVATPIVEEVVQTVPPLTEPVVEAPTIAQPETIPISRRESPLGEIASPPEGLNITLLDNDEFKAGDSLPLRILVSRRVGSEEEPLSGVQVSVKVLGTTFRPVIQTLKTARDGVAIATTQIPHFTSGRAAILIRATAGADTTEIRRVIAPGQ